MKKRLILGIFSMLTCAVFLTACGPSKDKIAQAQAKYRELVATHNQVAEAHKEIEDDSLNEELKELSLEVNKLTGYNLYEMTDEDIDELISTMDILNNSYSSYLKEIGTIKLSEDAGELESISFTLINGTDNVFNHLRLMEKGETDLVTDVLESVDGFLPGQEIMGLTVFRDVDNTPWVLSLTVSSDEGEEQNIEIDIEVSELPLEGASLKIVSQFDEITGKDIFFFEEN